MDKFFDVDWHSIFVPTESLVEIFIRGTLMYLGMFTLLRIFRRQAGAIGIADLLVIVVIADAAQNGMAGGFKVDYRSDSAHYYDCRMELRSRPSKR